MRSQGYPVTGTHGLRPNWQASGFGRDESDDQERLRIRIEMLDGVEGGNQAVMVLRNGTMRGGDSFFYAYGTYTDETAYGEGIALAGKQSIRFRANLRLLIPD